jgi:hypothetical protein
MNSERAMLESMTKEEVIDYALEADFYASGVQGSLEALKKDYPDQTIPEMSKRAFMQRYVLNKSWGTDGHMSGYGAAGSAEQAWNEIEKRCK